MIIIIIISEITRGEARDKLLPNTLVIITSSFDELLFKESAEVQS